MEALCILSYWLEGEERLILVSYWLQHQCLLLVDLHNLHMEFLLQLGDRLLVRLRLDIELSQLKQLDLLQIILWLLV